MFCRNCGKEVDDKAYVCPYCGVIVGKNGAETQPKNDSNILAVIGFVLSFVIPLAGLICSILGYNKSKNEGLPYKNLAFAGIIISTAVMVLSVVVTTVSIISVFVGLGAIIN